MALAAPERVRDLTLLPDRVTRAPPAGLAGRPRATRGDASGIDKDLMRLLDRPRTLRDRTGAMQNPLHLLARRLRRARCVRTAQNLMHLLDRVDGGRGAACRWRRAWTGTPAGRPRRGGRDARRLPRRTQGPLGADEVLGPWDRGGSPPPRVRSAVGGHRADAEPLAPVGAAASARTVRQDRTEPHAPVGSGGEGGGPPDHAAKLSSVAAKPGARRLSPGALPAWRGEGRDREPSPARFIAARGHRR